MIEPRNIKSTFAKGVLTPNESPSCVGQLDSAKTQGKERICNGNGQWHGVLLLKGINLLLEFGSTCVDFLKAARLSDAAPTTIFSVKRSNRGIGRSEKTRIKTMNMERELPTLRMRKV